MINGVDVGIGVVDGFFRKESKYDENGWDGRLCVFGCWLMVWFFVWNVCEFFVYERRVDGSWSCVCLCVCDSIGGEVFGCLLGFLCFYNKNILEFG